MEEQKKTLLFSVILSVLLTTFVVSSVMFFLLYKTKQEKISNENFDLNSKVCPEIARFCNDGSMAEVGDNCEKICPNDKNDGKSKECGECPQFMPPSPDWCKDGEIIPSKEDECGCLGHPTCLSKNENNQQQNQGSATFIPKGAVVWQEPQNVGDLGILKGLETTDCGENVSAEYYLTGKIKSGTYKDNNIYTIILPTDCGMGISYMTLRAFWSGKEGYTFLKGYERFNDYEFESLKEAIISKGSQSKVINGNIIIEDLVFPEKLVSGKIALHKRNYEDSFFNNEVYNVLKKAFMSGYGQVWVTDRIKSDNFYKSFETQKKVQDFYNKYGIFVTNAFYLKAPDGSVITYRSDLSSIANNYKDGDDDRILELPIAFSDGEKRGESYETHPGGCGLKSYAYDFTGKVTLNDLVAVGKFKNGDVVYSYKDINHPEFKNLYEKIYFAKDGQKKPQAEFLKMYSQIFWVDPVGRILSFYSTDIISPAECGKPVIYLYPEKEMDVQVQVFPNQGFTITDPVYGENGWLVKATPKGVLTNYADGKNYPYLFWEGNSDEIYIRSNKGFVVGQNDLNKFFDEKLAKLGLNSQEIYDFKEFWIPKMKEENKSYYFVTFVSQNFINKIAPLKITPKPDSVIRVLMDYEGLDEFKQVEELPIVTPQRNGFTAVEWGGMLH